MSNLYLLSDAQMECLKPFFPKSHGKPRVDDRRVLSGIIFINRNGLRWCDVPKEYGPARAPIFLLVPQVRLPKRLDLARDAERGRDAVPGLIVANWGDGRRE